MKLSDEYKSLQLKEQEKEAIRAYNGLFHEVINNILEPGIENEEEFNKTTGIYKLDSDTIQRAIRVIQDLYSALYKNFKSSGSFKDGNIYRGTTVEDVKRLEKNGQAYRFTSATYDRDMATGYFSINWNNPAFFDINIGESVPYLYVGDVLEDYGNNWERELILSPFLKLEKFMEKRSWSVEKSKGHVELKHFYMMLEKQQLPEISEEQENILEKELTKTAGEQYSRIIEILNQEEQIKQKIGLLRIQLVSARRWLAEAKDLKEKANVRKDLDYINEELEKAEEEAKEKHIEIDKLLNEVNEWKSKMRTLCMSKCRKVEKEIDKQFELERAKKREESKNEFEKTSREKVTKYIDEIRVIVESNKKRLKNSIILQRELSEISGKIGTELYEYIKNPSLLLSSQEEVSYKVKSLEQCVNNDFANGRYYLGEYTVAEQIQGIRDEIKRMQIEGIDEIPDKQKNAFVKGIYDKFYIIKAEADLLNLTQELEQINSRSGIRKVWDKVTGKEIVIQARQTQIKTILEQIKKKKRLIECEKGKEPKKEYNIVDVSTDMEIFVAENSQLEYLKEKTGIVSVLLEQVKSSLDIDQEEVERILQEKQGRRMPVVLDKTKSKVQIEKERAENFLIENGYGEEEQETNRLDEYKINSMSTEFERVRRKSRHVLDLIDEFLENDDRKLEERFNQMNQCNKDFLNKNGIDVVQITKAVDCGIYTYEEVNPLLAQNAMKFMGESSKRNICVGDILGKMDSFSSSSKTESNIFDTLDDYFDEKGADYQKRSIGMLEFNQDNVVDELRASFDFEPIECVEADNGKYLISINGLHRFTVLKILYLKAMQEARGDKEKEEAVRERFMITANVADVDKNKSYATYLLRRFQPMDYYGYDIESRQVTEKNEEIITLSNIRGESQVLLLTDEEGQEFNHSIKSIDNQYDYGLHRNTGNVEVCFMNRICEVFNESEYLDFTRQFISNAKNKGEIVSQLQEYYNKFESFRTFIDDNFSDILRFETNLLEEAIKRR